MKSLFALALVAILTVSCSSIEPSSIEAPVEPETVKPEFVCNTPEEVTGRIIYDNQSRPNIRIIELDPDGIRIFSYNWNKFPPPSDLPMDKVITFFFPTSQQVIILISNEGCVRAVQLWDRDSFLLLMEDITGI
jgi:hypothetical protein